MSETESVRPGVSMPLIPVWHITLRLPDAHCRSLLRELRGRPDVVIRDVEDRIVTVEVSASDEDNARRAWAPAAVLAAFRVDGGWSGDWWDGQDSKVVETECVLGTVGADSNASQLVAVPFRHFSPDGSGRRLTLFWNGYAFCEAGPVWADDETTA
jgi:hypothetical protein